MTQQATATMPQAEQTVMPVIPQDAQVSCSKENFKKYFISHKMQMLEQKFQKNEAASDKFFNELVSTLDNNPGLASCSIYDVLSEAFYIHSKGASLDVKDGEAFIIPYKNKPQHQFGYKFQKNRLLRSGEYSKLEVATIHEGELLSYNRLEAEATFDFKLDTAGLKVIGYAAFFIYRNKHTGLEMKRTMVWSVEQMISHAKAYVKTLSNTTFEQLYAASQQHATSGIGWLNNFEKMAHKTMFWQLMSNAPLSKEDREIFNSESNDVSSEDRHTQIINSASQPVDDMTFEDVDNAPSAQPTF